MKNNRRDFLKITGLTGIGLLGADLTSYASNIEDPTKPNLSKIKKQAGRKRIQEFNMSGYAAPKLETVRVGIVGLGNRGPIHLSHLNKLEGVEIKGLCDIRPEKIAAAQKQAGKILGNPTIYTNNEDEWKKMCDRDDIDIIYIATPWELHTPIALYAMNRGKHVAIEVPSAKTMEECWQLVETSERTKKHCIILENACYDFFELLTLNMARQGFFGEIIHCEGAYIHDLLMGNFSKEKNYQQWRLKENSMRNGNLYPTHGLGPIAQIMDINRGDKFDYLVSCSSNDFMMGETAKKLASTDDFYKPFVGKNYRGNMNTTTIRTTKGRTIMLQHDVTSPRPYSRIHLVSGTKAVAQKYPLPPRISNGAEDWITQEEYDVLVKKYNPKIVEKVGDLAKQMGGHGGIDFLMNWRLIDCLRNGLPVDMDVYDAALWSCIGPLSEWSVANRSSAIDVPDFTGGSWKKNQPIDISLDKGANTKLKAES